MLNRYSTFCLGPGHGGNCHVAAGRKKVVSFARQSAAGKRVGGNRTKTKRQPLCDRSQILVLFIHDAN